MQPLTPKEQLLYDAALHTARAQFEAEGQASPVLMAVKPDTGEIGVVSLAGMSKNEVGGYALAIRQRVALAIILEAWTTRIDSAKSPALAAACKAGDVAMLIPPREALDRKECVLVQFMHKDRRIISRAIITRHADTKPTLGEWETMDSADKGSGFHTCNFDDGKGKLASGIVNERK